jgi:hypothetical protein
VPRTIPEGLQLASVIASEGKQCIAPPNGSMDCFVALLLAMTPDIQTCFIDPRRHTPEILPVTFALFE